MKNQALLSSKDSSKKLKCRLLQFLFGALRVKGQTSMSGVCNYGSESFGVLRMVIHVILSQAKLKYAQF